MPSSAFAGSGFAGSHGGGAAEPAGPPTTDPAAYAQHPSGAADQHQQSQQQQQQQHQNQQQALEQQPPPPQAQLPTISLSMRELRSFSSLSRRAEQVWGCLRPAPDCKGQLPFVLLQGRGVAVGRGRDAYNERLSQLALSRASSLASSSFGRGSLALAAAAAAAVAADGAAQPPSPTQRRRSSEGGTRGCTFVEVADGRVSRLHAVVRYDALRQHALLEDLSSNGTYVNGERVGQGRSVPLADGDRISLVLSVAPLAEQAWIFHTGDPRGLEGDIPAIWSDDSLQARRQTSPVTLTGGASLTDELPSSRPGADVPAGGPLAATSARLARCNTSSYSTKDAITLEDLQCQICLCTLRDCVALEPCGHNYCAACLSHHFAALLRGGQPLACPMRCAPPQRVVANKAVRQLLACPGALLALAPSLRRSSLQQPLSSQLQGPSSVLEPLPEVQPASGCSSAGGSGSSGLPPGSCLPSAVATPADSLRAQAAAEALLEGSKAVLSAAEAGVAAAAAAAAEEAAEEAAAAEGGRPASAGSAAASSEAESPSSTASDYRHVILRPSSAAARPLATPPPSPFLSFAPSRRFGSLRSGDLDDPGRQAPVALPGAPTMQAASPLAAAATQPDTAGPTALPGQETMLAVAPLGAAASEPSVQGPMALPGEPTLAADSPFVLQSGSLLRQQGSAEQAGGLAQQHQQQHQPPLEVLTEEPLDSLEEAVLESGGQGAVASSVASAPQPGSWAALAAQLNASAAQRQQAGSGGGGEQPAVDGTPAAPAVSMQSLPSAGSAAVASQSTDGDEAPLPMHPLCPLDDSVLPLETSNLKTQQLKQALIDVLGSQTPGEATSGLEALARLTWSDEAARLELVQELNGTERVAAVMDKFRDSDGVQCTGCLALLALLRGEGPAADAARRGMEDGSVISTIAEGMKAHPQAPMVQLSALLCLVPLALNHTDMQMTVARLCLPSILAAIHENVAEFEVVAKGLILLGVLGQGDEEGHEAIRTVIVQRTLFPQLVAAVLAVVAPESEDVLWSALFALAVIARDTSSQFVAHMLVLVQAGVLPALQHALAAYRQTMDAQDQEPDEMIWRAGEYLVVVLTKARRLLWLRRSRRLWQAGLLGVAALAAFRWLRQRAGHRAGAGGSGRR